MNVLVIQGVDEPRLPSGAKQIEKAMEGIHKIGSFSCSEGDQRHDRGKGLYDR